MPCKHASIAVVISTSSSELRFFRAQVRECQRFAAQIIVAFGTHRYDGVTEEPFTPFVELAKEHPDVSFVSYVVSPPGAFHNPLKRKPAAFWHNVARIAGVGALKEGIDWVVFLDGDEIPDGRAFQTWAEHTLVPKEHEEHAHGFAFSNYWYFKEPENRATTTEISVVMVPRSLFSSKEGTVRILMHDFERYGFPDFVPLHVNVVSLDGSPMFHHFSWVRSKEDILRKVRDWGHKSDRPWQDIIHEKWDQPFDGTDFVHGYQYTRVENIFEV